MITFARALGQWDHLGTIHFRTRAKENGTLCKNPNFVRKMSLSDVDSVRARKILSMQMAVLSLSCYTQPLYNRIFIVHDYYFDNTSFCHANTNFTRQ